MTKEEFTKLDILEQTKYINSRTITGLTVVEVAQGINISESALRRIFKKNNYVFDRVEKVYLLAGNNTAIPQETTTSNNKGIPKEEPKGNNKGIIKEVKSNNNYFTKEEIKGIKELLAVKEELLNNIGITPGNKTGITIIDISNIDRANRKKATFNLSLIHI